MGGGSERGWFAEKVLPGGSEPDPRFTLANERTFLAWIRTSLAFIAGGIAIEAFAADVFEEPLRRGLALFIVVLGILLSAGATLRWLRTESSMRHGRPLKLPLIAPLLGIGGALAGAAVVVLVLLGR
ncbi:YidH family protein [Zafaria sp. Z1313]|uniref:YidH family protein n=1 Tax=unclassified Zafaria TaxID=2828765 RepID=UPI002E77AA2F|nr:DUF202 domain-containing protein [Zafaria sp. J156]MEE1622557.1 DUF202 domain-containing protein [Zafaria sp. J156]